jgi:hypothetical protein
MKTLFSRLRFLKTSAFVTRAGTRSRTFVGCASLLIAFLFSSGALAADKFAAVPERLQQFVTSNEISGAVALVATRDRVLHLSAVGQSDLASGRKMETSVCWEMCLNPVNPAGSVQGIFHLVHDHEGAAFDVHLFNTMKRAS